MFYRHLILILLGLLLSYFGNAQLTFKGVIYKSDSTQPLDQVMVLQPSKMVGLLTNSSGAFRQDVDSHSIVIFKRIGYKTDTVFVKKMWSRINKNIINYDIHMEELPIQLNTFNFVRKKPIKTDPYERRQEWSYVLDRSHASAQSPITALYQQFSKKGRELQKLEALYYADERKREMEARFSRLQAILLTGLQGKELDAYLFTCRPSYERMMQMSDYELIIHMKQCFEYYKPQHSDSIPPTPTQIDK